MCQAKARIDQLPTCCKERISSSRYLRKCSKLSLSIRRTKISPSYLGVLRALSLTRINTRAPFKLLKGQLLGTNPLSLVVTLYRHNIQPCQAKIGIFLKTNLKRMSALGLRGRKANVLWRKRKKMKLLKTKTSMKGLKVTQTRLQSTSKSL